MATQVSEREKETFPSQPITNYKDVRSTPSNPAQINTIHTLRSEKKVDNQVVMPDQTNTSLPTNAPSSSGSDKLKEKEAEQVTKPIYEPPAPFPNRLKPKKHSAQVEKALEIFQQVKVSIPLLNVIEQCKILKGPLHEEESNTGLQESLSCGKYF